MSNDCIYSHKHWWVRRPRLDRTTRRLRRCAYTLPFIYNGVLFKAVAHVHESGDTLQILNYDDETTICQTINAEDDISRQLQLIPVGLPIDVLHDAHLFIVRNPYRQRSQSQRRERVGAGRVLFPEQGGQAERHGVDRGEHRQGMHTEFYNVYYDDNYDMDMNGYY